MKVTRALDRTFQSLARNKLQPEGISAPAFTPAELPKGRRLPASWRQLLADQTAGKPLDWKPLWGSVFRRLPVVRRILTQFSAVAIGVNGDGRPVLAYLQDWDDVVGATYGPAPVTRSAARRSRYWGLLPSWLQDWYTSVHNGWHINYKKLILEGLLPLERMYLASTYVTPEEVNLQPVDRPLDLDQVLVVMKGGLGTWICLDAAERDRSGTPKGLYWPKGYAPIRGNAATWINEFLEERFLLDENEEG